MMLPVAKKSGLLIELTMPLAGTLTKFVATKPPATFGAQFKNL